MSTPPNQMKFDWDLPEDESSSELSVEEIQLRKLIAEAFIRDPNYWEKDEEGEPVKPYWLDHAIKLHEDKKLRFPFRAAVLAAWLSTPRKYRVPKTQKELANLLGLSSDRQFTIWTARNPQIMAVIHGIWRERSLDRLPDSLEAMYEVAAQSDYKGKGDRELHYKLSGILADTVNVNQGNVDLSKLGFDERWKLAGLDTPEGLEKLRRKMQAVADEEKTLDTEHEELEEDASIDGNA